MKPRRRRPAAVRLLAARGGMPADRGGEMHPQSAIHPMEQPGCLTALKHGFAQIKRISANY